MKLNDLPLDRPVAVVMLLLSLMVLGGVAIDRIPLDFMPEVEFPRVTVVVPFPGSHPLEGLQEVAKVIEEEIATIPDLEEVSSQSQSGEVSVNAQFGWDVDLAVKKMEVREAVERARAELPENIGSIRIQTHLEGPGDGAILEGRISAERDLTESWELLDRRIIRPLERIKGVARIELDGIEPLEVRVDLDPAALRRHGVQPSEVLETLRSANVDTDAGAVHGDVLRYDVRLLGRFRNLEQIEELQVGEGETRIRDVARVERREPEVPYTRHLDREAAIAIEAYKESSANTVETVDLLLERIAEIEKDPQLAGIELLVWNNAGEEIRGSLHGLRNAGIFGGFLAVFVLYFFLRRVQTTLIVAVAIPFSLVVTCGALFLLDQQFNVMTMLGLMLGVGMLVDNAVVVIENIYRRQSGGLDAREAARVGAREVTLAVVASTATTIIVWSWLFFTDRSPMTIYIGAVALTICLAVACSLLVSLTFIPLAAARFVPDRPAAKGFLERRLVPAYRRLLAWTLHHRLATLAVLLGLAGTAAYPILKIEKTFEPKSQKKFAEIGYEVYDAPSQELMARHIGVVEDWVESKREELGYENLYSWYHHERGWAVTRLYMPTPLTTEKAIKRVEGILAADLPVIPGVKLRIGEERWWHAPSDGTVRVPIALHGEDPEYLQELALEVEELMRTLPEAQDVWGPSIRGQKEAQVLVDPDRAHALGVTPRRIAETVGLTFRGRNLSRFYGPDGELEMILGLPEEIQPGLATLVDLPIPRDRGDTIPLGSVAEIGFGRTNPEIWREERKTTSWVSVEFSDELNTEQARELVTAKMAGLRLPEGYSWDWSRWGHDRDEGLQTMLTGVTLSLLAVLLLMAALFESVTQPFAILITLPLAFFGGFWSLFLLGYRLDAVAFVGVILLIGIVVNNGIVLVDHVNQLRRKGVPRVEALIEGCGDRLRPILMTAITTIFGLLPLAFSGFTVAAAYIDSLAVVVIGGLASSTFFTLLALPVWYTTVEDVGSVFYRSLPRRRLAGVKEDAVGAHQSPA